MIKPLTEFNEIHILRKFLIFFKMDRDFNHKLNK